MWSHNSIMMKVSALLLVVLATTSAYVTKNGTNHYVTYQVGGVNIPVVIAASHGGRNKDPNLPNRLANGCYNETDDECTYTYVSECSDDDSVNNCETKNEYSDYNTDKLANELADKLITKFGGPAGTEADRPHVIRCELHRSKVDVNRDIGEAAFGNVVAEKAWKEYHDFIDEAKSAATANHKRILFIDLHGQSSSEYNMIGMLLSDDGKNGFDKSIVTDRLAQYSSIMQLHVDSGISMEELVRGNTSIGGLMEPDFKMIPAPSKKTSGGSKYFSGGYSTRRHTGWRVSGFQVEVYKPIRYDLSQRQQFADKLADAVVYWIENYLKN